MFCPQCGAQDPEGAAVCTNCETPLQMPSGSRTQRGYVPAPPASNTALVSLIMGILGWVVLPVVGSVLAVVFGHAALREIDRSGGEIGGRGMAQAGLILGYVALAVSVLSAVLFVVLPALGCGLCSICGAFSSLTYWGVPVL